MFTKEQALSRAEYACERCGHPVIMAFAEFRHIRPKSEGGSDKFANCEAPCVKCRLAIPDPHSLQGAFVRNGAKALDSRGTACAAASRVASDPIG